MNHWIIFPILIPAVVAPLIVLTSRYDQVLARVFSTSATLLMLIVSGVLFHQVDSGPSFHYELGNWPTPFGIALVLDRLSATMLLLSSLLGFVIALATIDGWDDRGRHFHSLLLMQLGGINGAFLTGDLFNLFVCFEVMLIASYGLMVHGGGATRLRAGIQFVVINLCGSSVFLVALGLIYAATGGLNMIDVADKLSLLPPANRAIMSCGITLLMLVFALKAALVPLQFWLPSAYSYAPPLVAALFAIATKVGVYCIIRIQSVILAGNEHILSEWTLVWLLPAGLATIAVGMIGVVASRALGQMASYATLASSGTILVCLAMFSTKSFAGGMYYLVHSTIAGAALFLVIDAIVQRRPKLSDRLVVGSGLPQAGLIGGLFLITAIAMVGLPPLPGFIGKLLILDAVRDSEWNAWIWIVILSTSILGILGFARAGSSLFWKNSSSDDFQQKHGDPHHETVPRRELRPSPTPMTLIASGLLVVLLFGLTASAAPMLDNLNTTAAQVWKSE